MQNVHDLSKRGVTEWIQSVSTQQWVVKHTADLIQSKWFVSHQIDPLLVWTLRQESITVAPLVHLIVQSLPSAKEHVVESIKNIVIESLKSEQIKSVIDHSIIISFYSHSCFFSTH
jgi:hypothetical protein